MYIGTDNDFFFFFYLWTQYRADKNGVQFFGFTINVIYIIFTALQSTFLKIKLVHKYTMISCTLTITTIEE